MDAVPIALGAAALAVAGWAAWRDYSEARPGLATGDRTAALADWAGAWASNAEESVKATFQGDPYTVDVLARTIYGEARGETRSGREAVAAVIVNRAERGGWWGDTIAAVCRAPWQFSCWNKGDPNRAIIERVTAADPIFRECLEIAQSAVAGTLPDRTRGATHYHADYVSPGWAKTGTVSARVGAHIFYTGVA